jgi:hypothetical protein
MRRTVRSMDRLSMLLLISSPDFQLTTLAAYPKGRNTCRKIN